MAGFVFIQKKTAKDWISLLRKIPAPCGGKYIHLFKIFFMAKVKFGAFITDMSGKLGGQVIQRSSSGHIIRNKARFNRASSNRLNAWRATFAQVASQWRDGGAPNAAQYNAAAPNFLVTDRLGTVSTPSAFHLFMKMNLAGWRQIETLTTNPGSPTSFAIAGNFYNATFSLAFGFPAWYILNNTPTDQMIFVFASAGNSVGRSTPSGGYKFVNNVGSHASGPDYANNYVAVFGSPPLGSKVFLKFTIFSETSQTQSPPTFLDCIVTA